MTICACSYAMSGSRGDGFSGVSGCGKRGQASLDRARDGGALRLLVVLPFPPRLDATDGGGRSIAQLLNRLAVRHRLALVCLRSSDEPEVDPALQAACEMIHVVARPSNHPSAPGHWTRRARQVVG